MDYIRVLLNTNIAHVEVMKFPDTNTFGVEFKGAEVKEGATLKGIFGEGTSPNYAAYEYIQKINGKTLVFNPTGKDRKEIVPVFVGVDYEYYSMG